MNGPNGLKKGEDLPSQGSGQRGEPRGRSQLHPDTPQTGDGVLIPSPAQEEQREQYARRDVPAHTRFETNRRPSPLPNNIHDLQK